MPHANIDQLLGRFDDINYVKESLKTTIPRAQGLNRYLGVLAVKAHGLKQNPRFLEIVLNCGMLDEKAFLDDSYFVATIDSKDPETAEKDVKSFIEKVKLCLPDPFMSASYIPQVADFNKIKSDLDGLLLRSLEEKYHIHAPFIS